MKIKGKKYVFNPKQFCKFIVSLSFIIILIMLLINLIIKSNTSNTFETNKTSNIGETVVYAESVNDNETHIDESINLYDKKPVNLDDTYFEYMITASMNEDIPIEIILAIVTTENVTYNVNAYAENDNGTYDMGLCQINSAYVEYFGNLYNIPNFDPYNVEHAITFVCRHLKYLSDYGKTNYNLSDLDSYVFAAGAYNRGLGNECKYRNMYEYKEKFLTNYNRFK